MSAGPKANYEEYAGIIRNLKAVIRASHVRVIQEPPDPLFLDNVNLFAKAYLVSLCTCLEAFLQDVAFGYVSILKDRLVSAQVPHNAVRWSISKEFKEKEMRFVDFNLSTTRKEIAEELSGNPGKTIALFRCLGIDLQANSDFRAHKDSVGAVVTKRNKVVHHNDSAADVSMADLVEFADQILQYMNAVADCVASASTLR